jgi:branched-chain amino acid transport system permease protein
VDAAAVIQTVLLSLTVTGLYAAVASGLTLEWGVTRIINFAHGEFVMVGAFITYFLNAGWGLHPLLGMLVAAVAMGAFSAVVYRAFLARVLRQAEHNQLLATLGLSILLQNVAMILWTPNARAMHVPDIVPAIHVGGVTVPGHNVLVAIVGAALYVMLFLLMRKTRYGIQMRFASDDPELAVYAGVNVDRMFGMSFVIGGMMAGAAGGLVALILYVYPLVGLDLAIRAFAIVALGGLGNIPGALVGGAILSVIEGLTSTFVSRGASWGYGIAFMVLVAVLIARPSGLFGKQARS